MQDGGDPHYEHKHNVTAKGFGGGSSAPTQPAQPPGENIFEMHSPKQLSRYHRLYFLTTFLGARCSDLLPIPLVLKPKLLRVFFPEISFFPHLVFFAALSILYLLIIELLRVKPNMFHSRLVESFLEQARKALTHRVCGAIENANNWLSFW